MKARIAITIIALVIYLGLFSLYIFKFLTWSPYFDKLFYNWLTVGAISFAILDLKAGFINSHHAQINLIIFLSVLVNYLFIILATIEFFNYKSPFPMFYAYNGSVLVITLTIFFNELKYKIMGDND